MLEKFEFLAGGAFASFLMFGVIFIGLPESDGNTALVGEVEPSAFVRNFEQPPIAPSGATSTLSATLGHVTVRWTDRSTNEEMFVVERSVDGLTFQPIGVGAMNAVSFVDTAPVPQSLNYYRVYASNTYGESGYSNVTMQFVAGTPVATVPSAPQTLSGALSGSAALLTWVDMSNNETNFIVERRTDVAPTWITIGTLGVNAAMYSDIDVLANMMNYYRVAAKNSAGTSQYSNIVSVMGPVTAPTTTPAAPTAPTGLNAQNQSGSVRLSWTDTSSNETNFDVMRRVSTSTTWTTIGTVGQNVTQYDDVNPVAGVVTEYRVAAKNAVGQSLSVSVSITYVAPVSQGPAAPTNLTASVQAQGVQLTWVDVATNETGYQVERAMNGGAYTVYASLSTNKSSYLNTNAQAGVTYSYRVTALGSGGNSAGVTVTAVTPSTAPSAPVSLVGSVEGTVVSLSWTDTSGYETSFEVQKSTTGTTFTTVGTVAAAPANGAVSYTVYETLENRVFYYRVVAKNAFGSSVASNTVNVRTQSSEGGGGLE